PAIEPAVRAPRQPVDDVVSDAAHRPAIQHDLRLAIGHVVAIPVGNEQQVRGTEDPHAAEADRDAGQVLPLVPENGALVEAADVVAVLEDDYTIPVLRVPRLPGVGIALGDPQPATVIEAHGYRLAHLGLAREEADLEAGRHLDKAQLFLRGGGHVLGVL